MSILKTLNQKVRFAMEKFLGGKQNYRETLADFNLSYNLTCRESFTLLYYSSSFPVWSKSLEYANSSWASSKIRSSLDDYICCGHKRFVLC